MNSDDSKLKQELLTETFKLCDKIDEDYKKIVQKTNTSLKETFKECKECLDYIDSKKTELILLHTQIKKKPVNSWSEIIQEIIKHERKLVELNSWLRKLTSKSCSCCQSPLSNQPFIYQNNSLKQWSIKQPFNLEDTSVAFCSQSCFQQSIYYKAPNDQQSSTHTHTHTHTHKFSSTKICQKHSTHWK